MDPSKPDPLRISELLETIEASTFRTLSPSISEQKPKLKAAPKEIKMDPFEVRIRFTQYLQHLNATVTSANKTAQYALKYRDMDEDLHSCILEQLEKVSWDFFVWCLRIGFTELKRTNEGTLWSSVYCRYCGFDFGNKKSPLIGCLEFYEQSGEHYVLYRNSMRYGIQGRS